MGVLCPRTSAVSGIGHEREVWVVELTARMSHHYTIVGAMECAADIFYKNKEFLALGCGIRRSEGVFLPTYSGTGKI
jgi:hypothetical protein